jgi:hypothetical protein
MQWIIATGHCPLLNYMHQIVNTVHLFMDIPCTYIFNTYSDFLDTTIMNVDST